MWSNSEPSAVDQARISRTVEAEEIVMLSEQRLLNTASCKLQEWFT